MSTAPGSAARGYAAAGAFSAFLGVAAGAFGAHALHATLPTGLMAAFETGVRYQLIHAVALLGCGWAMERARPGAITLAAWLFLAGTVLFSGSLYGMALTGITRLGMVTPFGGLAFLVGWLALGFGLLRR